MAGGAAALQGEKCRQENEFQCLCKKLASASVPPLLTVKLVSHNPGAGSDLHLGAGVESSHLHVLPHYFSYK